MRPKSKLQFDVITKSKELHKRKVLILPWVVKDCLRHIGLATKNRVICMDCGVRFSSEIVNNNQAVCPNCRTKLEIEKSLSRTFQQKIYVGYAQIVGIYQVVRYFQINSTHKENKKTYNSCCEILQHWIRDDGKIETVARLHSVNYHCDSWSGGEMEIRKDYNRWGGGGGKYDVYTEFFHPKSEFKPEFEKIGINKDLAGLTFIEAKRIIPENPHAETLIKAKQYKLLSYLPNNNSKIREHWASIKICLRNEYIVKDASMWLDYIDLLRYFNRDLHNAFYVCPKNLKLAHDHLMENKRKIQLRENREKQRKKIKKEQVEYERHKKNFFGIHFTDGNILVKTLETIEEFMNEGDALHHCVFTNEYYKKQDSLILSARVKGVPTETIEVSLKKMEVVQSRGIRNMATEYHERILDLVRANIPQISQRLTV